jgi:predicted RNA binding protein YcfA (HicA-like mRNA interferase family)
VSDDFVHGMKVRDMVALIESKGWRLARTRGSHRQFHHRERPGTVTIAGKPGKDVSQDMIGSILKQAGLNKSDLA